LSILVLYYWG